MVKKILLVPMFLMIYSVVFGLIMTVIGYFISDGKNFDIWMAFFRSAKLGIKMGFLTLLICFPVYLIFRVFAKKEKKS